MSCSCHFLSFHVLPYHSHRVWCALASVVMVARRSVFSIALHHSPSFSLCLPVSYSFSYAVPSGCSLISGFFSPQLDPLLLLSFSSPVLSLCLCPLPLCSIPQYPPLCTSTSPSPHSVVFAHLVSMPSPYFFKAFFSESDNSWSSSHLG